MSVNSDVSDINVQNTLYSSYLGENSNKFAHLLWYILSSKKMTSVDKYVEILEMFNMWKNQHRDDHIHYDKYQDDGIYMMYLSDMYWAYLGLNRILDYIFDKEKIGEYAKFVQLRKLANIVIHFTLGDGLLKITERKKNIDLMVSFSIDMYEELLPEINKLLSF